MLVTFARKVMASPTLTVSGQEMTMLGQVGGGHGREHDLGLRGR